MTDAKPSPENTGTQHQPRSIRWWLGRCITPMLILVAGILLIVAVGIAQRTGWIQTGVSGGGAAVADAATTYTCPMHPQIRQPAQGRCPICGMELVVAGASGRGDLDSLSVRIAPAQRRLAQIETAAVRFEPVQEVIATVGSIAIDESRMATIASYIDGRIERLFADYTGVQVAKSDHLAVVYSGELYSAQVEYLENRRSLAGNSSSLAAVRQAQEKFVVNARRKLEELGLQEAQIRELETSGKAESRQTIYAPMGGTVIEKLAVEGKYVKAGEPD